ncbi:SMPDL3 [Acanthosepion pharaonis]|uniref:SMPDL3 n=1 Tax=Acanthosepion pharaonis TaxID=158019 RepID=A0A812D8F7_ACAPH|nr:SMPDL3 [Sepia pharaonis]
MSGGKTRKILLFLILTTTITSSQGKNIGTFWAISDLHHDFTYGVKKEPESCRSVIPYTQLGMFGDYDCDTPWIMLNQTIYSMKQLAPDVDFILWMGDSVMHTRRDEALTLNKTVNIGTIRDITNLIKEAFPEVPLIPTVGNHDFFRDSQTSTAMLESMSKVFFNETELHTATFKKGGYFSANVSPRLRLLNLNTIYYYKRNKNVNPTTNVDPADQFDWLEKQLQLSKKENKKVFITGHISPGFSPHGLMWFYSQYNQRFIFLVQQYADVINAMFFGHDHKSSFKIITTNGKGSVPVFIVPSVTPWTYTYNHNPAMWLVNYDREFLGDDVKIREYFFVFFFSLSQSYDNSIMAKVRISSDIIKPFSDQGDVVAWLKKVRLVARLQHVDDVASLLPLYLEGDALALYMEMEEEDQGDIDQIEARLKQAFADDAFSAYRKLTMVRWTGERVDVYANKVRQFVRLAGFEGAEMERLTKLAFVMGFPDTIALRLRQAPNVEALTVGELLARARVLKSTGDESQNVVAAVRTPRSVGASPAKSGPRTSMTC